MARAVPTAWWWLGVLTALRPTPETQGAERVTKVFGFLNKSVMLPCSMDPDKSVKVTQVTWVRQEKTVAVFTPQNGPQASEKYHFVNAKKGEEMWNASLVVNNLTIQDEANYTCQFALYPMGGRRAVIWLRVMAQGQNKAEALKVDHPSSESVQVAQCDSNGYRPGAKITWSSDFNGTFKNIEEKPGLQPGTFDVTSVYLLKPSSQVNGQNVTCIVQHETLEEPVILSVELSVSYPPEVSISGYDGNWYLGRRQVNLTCDVRSNPAPTAYHWSTTSGPLPPSVEAQGKLLRIPIVDESINTTFICQVTSDVGEGQNETYTPVKEAPAIIQSGLSSSAKIAIIIVIVVVFLVVIFVVARRRKLNCQHCGWNRSSPSAENMGVQYSAVSNGAGFPQEAPMTTQGSAGRGTELVTSES